MLSRPGLTSQNLGHSTLGVGGRRHAPSVDPSDDIVPAHARPLAHLVGSQLAQHGRPTQLAGSETRSSSRPGERQEFRQGVGRQQSARGSVLRRRGLHCDSVWSKTRTSSDRSQVHAIPKRRSPEALRALTASGAAAATTETSWPAFPRALESPVVTKCWPGYANRRGPVQPMPSRKAAEQGSTLLRIRKLGAYWDEPSGLDGGSGVTPGSLPDSWTLFASPKRPRARTWTMLSSQRA